ncbi:MAG TPA: RcnB family protein [Rhizomicrobium sp.]|jgi:Ni/Co efflux regulator RcnB
MRSFLISVAVLSLVGGATLAMAQDRGGPDGQRGGERGGAQHQNAPNPAANGRGAIGERQFREHHDAPSPQRPAPQPARPAPAQQNPADAAAQQMRGINRAFGNAPQPNAGRPEANRPNNNNRPDFRGQDNRGNDQNRGRDNNRRDFGNNNNRRPDFNNGQRGQRRDYSNYRNYHQNFRADRRFRAPSYRRPQGWYSHRWTWGETLPISFWARDYWLNDFGAYDLPPPPFGAVWVRVGDDALLIDQDSGEIIEVDYGVFY